MTEAGTSERESREFFYVTDQGGVTKVVGYACETAIGNQGYWWCPEVGVSAAEGYNLFRDRVEAYEVAVARARRTADLAMANLTRIEEERWK